MIQGALEIFVNEIFIPFRRSDCPQPIGGASVKIFFSGKEIIGIAEKGSNEIGNMDMNDIRYYNRLIEIMRNEFNKILEGKLNGIERSKIDCVEIDF
jgi:hypothetical protein